MRKKRQIKQLMALGIQRNDAAGFVEAYRVIKAKKKEYMLPVIMTPPPPVAIERRPIRTIAAVYRATERELYTLPPEEADKLIKRRLANNLANGLLDMSMYRISKRALPPASLYEGPSIEYRLYIDVVEPLGGGGND
jgi:hypothetical protein